MNLKEECERSFYRELYQFDGRSQALVMEETTGALYLRKERMVFERSVYDFLVAHHHPHIANVHSYHMEGEKLIILEEYIEGETLESCLNAGEKDPSKALSDEERRGILLSVCNGLTFLHTANPPVIHRDLKASNIMLGKDGTVKIIDYDAARTYKEGLSKDTQLLGTQGVAAPEQYGFAQTDARTDIYALGVLMEQLFPDDARYTEMIAKAKHIDPDRRYQSVEELAAALQKRTKSKRRFPVVIIAAVILVIVIFAAIVSARRSKENTAIESQTEHQVTDDREDKSKATEHSASETTTALPLELEESGIYMERLSDTVYVRYAGKIHNPNEALNAQFPKLIVTFRNSDGSILTTNNQTGSIIMPGDTITLCGMLSMPSDDITEDAQIGYEVECSNFSNDTLIYSAARTTDFEIMNVSEGNGSECYITGEIANHFKEDIDTVNLAMLLKKEGEIVYIENTFVDNVRAGQSKAFQFQRYSSYPEHDEIELSAMAW